jgi:hypothetical protein
MQTRLLFAAAVVQNPPEIKRAQGDNVILPWLNENIHIRKQHVKKAAVQAESSPRSGWLFFAAGSFGHRIKLARWRRRTIMYVCLLPRRVCARGYKVSTYVPYGSRAAAVISCYLLQVIQQPTRRRNLHGY